MSFFFPVDIQSYPEQWREIRCKVKQAGLVESFCCRVLFAIVILSHLVKYDWIHDRNLFTPSLTLFYVQSVLVDLPYIWHGETKPKPTDPDGPVLGFVEDVWTARSVFHRGCSTKASRTTASVNRLPQAVMLHLRNSQRTAKCIWATLKVWDNFVQLREKKKSVLTGTLCCQCNILCGKGKGKKKLILMPILQLLPVSWQHRAELNVLAIQLLTSLHLSLSTVAEWNALGGQMRIHLR